jgi:dipeptidyl aminopeptidase/acylaminoacyl peptidase
MRRTSDALDAAPNDMPNDTQTPAPFGSWPSPITAELIAGANIRLGQVALRGADVFWLEGRPQEQGRNVLVQRLADGSVRDVNPAPFNVRTRAHEYGGGAFVLLPDGVIFSHYDDQQLYRISNDRAPVQLTKDADRRYADAVHDASRQRLVAIREDHTQGSIDAVASVVSIALDSGAVRVLADGHDFFSSPCLSPDGTQLAWLAWNHPNMPWDGTELWLAGIADDGSLVAPHVVAGGEAESIHQPQWSPKGELHFASDRSGWWNLYRLRGATVQALHPMEAEFGQAQWAFGMSSYGFDDEGRIVCVYHQGGIAHLARLDTANHRFETLATPCIAIDSLHVGTDFAVFLGGTGTQAGAVMRIDLRSLAHEVLRSSSTATADPANLALAEAISFPTEGGLVAHAFFYPPTNRDFRGPAGERPPLMVISHGGPTGSTDATFKWSYQFWTSRGFAIVDVNYGGSTGYGRAYRERLKGQWGVVDVDDSVNAARFLIDRGDVDPARVLIRGGSAGGYTTLCALTFRDFFKAGASHYGIGDLESLMQDSHKFESRYCEGLIGPYPQAIDLYRARSPVHFTDRLSSPMILLQGAEDKAVPPNQAQAMFDAVSAKGLPVAYLLFEGEQHGFRRATTIKRALEAELYFFGKVFGFDPADEIEPVDIRNLPERVRP